MFLHQLRAACGETPNMRGVADACCQLHSAIETRLRRIGQMDGIEQLLVAVIGEVVKEAANETAAPAAKAAPAAPSPAPAPPRPTAESGGGSKQS